LLNPNCNENLIPLRKWPVEYFVTVAQSLLASHPSLIIGIIGAKSEKLYVDSVLAQINHHRVISFAGKTSLKELLVLLNHAVALITNDSGPSHLAALTKTHILTLFGPETPILYAPLSKQATNFYLSLKCSPCITIYNGKRTVCDNNLCLKSIHPDHIIQMIEKEQLVP
jgi:ADP-heptose:LPS heptosyltransferase